jgi:hypothetical protein
MPQPQTAAAASAAVINFLILEHTLAACNVRKKLRRKPRKSECSLHMTINRMAPVLW